MKYAVIKNGGRQYKVFEGEDLLVDNLFLEEGKEVDFDQVLLLVDEDKIKIGQPIIEKTVVKAKVKGAQISTDIIVGFPSETKQQFQNTIKLARAANFAYAYVSKYSARPNTAATKALKDNVPYAEKEKRFFALDQIINHKGTIRSAVH